MEEKPQFEDTTLVCVDCRNPFVWSKGEQFYWWARGLAPVKRCPACRLRRRITINPDPSTAARHE